MVEVGMTCRLGKSKTAVQWEVIGVDGDQVSLSKLGGHGYVNKWSKPGELRDVHPRLLEVTLGNVLGWQEKVRDAAKALDDCARVFSNAGKAVELGQRVAAFTEAFHKAVAGYEAGIREHYPHLIKGEGN